ncbi:MAG: TRAP transporter small permease subunit [Gammaproteobacteria bacterium]|nr:TRAP transporter small permease subunit [Gammaproteobacteria bacterium]MDH5653153.1 TRAP transporter small permease subunit [Gammaproteobacteria bacterium]
MRQLAAQLEAISEKTGQLVAWLTLAMVVLTFIVVVLRYAFNTGWIGMQELITYLHAFVFMLGAAYTLKHEGHVRVDIFYRKMSPRRQALVDFLGCLLLLFPVCLFILWSSWEYVFSSWKLLEGSPEADGLPLVFVLKTAILLMAVLLLLQGLAQLLRALLQLQESRRG